MQVIWRKKPIQRRSLATVECVLEAATRILEEQGLAGLNTNSVAQRAGISIGSLYQYFPSKEAITAALILRSHEHIVTAMRELLATTQGLPARAAIDALLTMLLAPHAISPKINRILEAEEMRLPRTPETQAAEREIEELNRAFFGRYVDRRHCSDEQLRIATADTICIVRSLLESSTFNGEADLEGRLRRAVYGYLGPLLRLDASETKTRDKRRLAANE